MSQENLPAVVSGSFFSLASSFPWILQMQTPGSVIEEWAIKLLSTVVIAVVGGVFGMVGKDFYTWAKNQFNK